MPRERVVVVPVDEVRADLDDVVQRPTAQFGDPFQIVKHLVGLDSDVRPTSDPAASVGIWPVTYNVGPAAVARANGATGAVRRHPGERERVNPVAAHSPLTGTVAASPCVTMPV
ncbi:MAG: hypothetical protein ACXWZ5_15630 [Mycobacterium sp.]